MTYQELFSLVRSFLSIERENKSYKEYLCDLLGDYEKALRDLEVNAEDINISLVTLVGKVHELSNNILDCLDTYTHARLDESINMMKDILKEESFSIYRVEQSSKWYRGRTVSGKERVYKAEQMFHVPFELVRKIGNARYSISGYPCLYLSNTIWGCWEELGEPALEDFCTSLVKPSKPIDLLDLRMPRMEQNDKLASVLYTLPLVIACSIEVQYVEDPFKPEYVLPQIVMLALADSPRFMGCIFTSSKTTPNFEWPDDLLWNIAMPVICVKDNGLCPKLSNLFVITDAINYRYEVIKCNVASLRHANENDIEEIFGVPHVEETAYENYQGSIFGQLENVLSEEQLKNIS